MAAKLDIFNLALLRLGAPPTLDPDENAKRTIALNNCYELVRDLVLRDHPWNFATRRAPLSLLAEAPAFGYSYKYQLPDDCLRVLGLVYDGKNVDPSLDYQVEGGELLTDETVVQLMYTARVENAGLYDSGFVSALASRLAAEVAYHVTGSAGLAKLMMENYAARELPAAKAMDAQENPPVIYESETWHEARS